MRQINFLIIFTLCLALVLFSLENTEPASIQVIQGLQVEAPLAIELLLAMWLGAVLAWVFSIWTQLLKQLEHRQNLRQLRSKDERIQELEKDFENYKEQVEEKEKPLLSASETNTEQVEEVLAE
ncbi:lipopolysaccharide assembly protein LapA domain-containing protein [Lyngbya aestuarii]|uniref:lipopolysaccharide assembly protein LapA domain-containing protein n=1 Tax=Lyngbya aestuarii TaxID=118322 RepID=UPI00403D8B54